MLQTWVTLIVVQSLFYRSHASELSSVRLEWRKPESGASFSLGDVVFLCEVVGSQMMWVFEGLNRSSLKFFPSSTTEVGQELELGPMFTVILKSITSEDQGDYVFTSVAKSTHGLTSSDVGKTVSCGNKFSRKSILIPLSDVPFVEVCVLMILVLVMSIAVLHIRWCCRSPKGHLLEEERSPAEEECIVVPADSNPATKATGNKNTAEPSKERWYHGPITDTEAESRCVNRYGKPRSDGAYLVRRVGTDYYLYVCYKEVPCKYRILHHEQKWEVDGNTYTHNRSCTSLEDLIRHHRKKAVKVRTNESVKLKTPVLS